MTHKGRLNKFMALFKSSSNITSQKKTSLGNAGFDNIRENIDPHVKTKVLRAKEIILEDGAAAGYVKNAADGTLSGGNDLGSIAEDIIPAIDDTYDLGSLSKKWAYVYAVIAVLTSIAVGGVIGIQNIDGVLFINASTEMNGSLQVNGDATIAGTLNASNIFFVDNTSNKIGIGIVNPQARLTLKQLSNGVGGGVRFIRSDTTTYWDIYEGGDNILYIQYNGGAQTYATIKTDGGAYFAGKVGIGTTSPKTTLHVNGNITTVNMTITNLSGVGNDYVCVNENGALFRSDAAC